ncbi:hypothetical protein [Natronoglycomyces albus]|uniref:Uncharacterized protein n=1 Tax=Natronoglycomyces albus TaxID=2811108 RepID=A0A895XEV8_9ACTN|nr:hypothetical protein [Natronoglycomyces albus]QSB04371.1 hypothetical protein JQS30_11265 [Natronoglycomyces albus]
MVTISEYGHPVVVPSDLAAALMKTFEETYDVAAVEKRLREAGYGPPDDREGWTIDFGRDPASEAKGMYWAPPSDSQE